MVKTATDHEIAGESVETIKKTLPPEKEEKKGRGTISGDDIRMRGEDETKPGRNEIKGGEEKRRITSNRF